ncbi:MAG: DUF4340 domain-containing protein [Planctomycetota bacterium]
MNFKTTLVMLVLLAGIAGAYLWVRSSGPGGASNAQATPDPFVTGRVFDAIQITQDEQSIALTKQPDGSWWQTEPVRFPVTGEAVETLINAGLSLLPRETFSFDADDPAVAGQADALAAFGLDPPQAVVVFESDSVTHEIRLGSTNVAGTAYLQKTGDDRVHLVDAVLHRAALDAEPKTWRPTQLPMLDPDRINRVALSNAQHQIELTRSVESWSLDAEGRERADAEKSQILAALVQAAQPSRYVSDDPAALAQYGLVEPMLALTTADATGTRQTLRLGQPADLGEATVYATWSDTEAPSPVVFTVPLPPFRNLTEVTPLMLRDARVVLASPGSIRGQEVNRVGRDVVTIAQNTDGTGLGFVEPQTGYAPDPERTAEWLTTLTRVVSTGYAPAPREAQAPLALIELKLAGGQTEHVRLYADRDGRDDVLLAVRENETIAALVPSEQLASLRAPVVTLRDRRLPDVGPINELRLSRDDGQVFSFTRSDPGLWAPQNDDFTDAWEAAQFAELWDWVESPRVATWTSMSELPRGPIARLSLGPEKPAYVVNVDQHLGQRTDLPGVFELPEDVAALFGEEYRQKLMLPYRADQIDRVVLGIESSNDDDTALPEASTIQRNAEGVFVNAAGERYDNQDECAALVNTLAGLNAKRLIPALLPEQQQTPIKYWEIHPVNGEPQRLLRYNQGVWSLNNESYFFIDLEADRQLTRKDTAWGAALVQPETPQN